jgi:GNAT superfamily N-acetyltransferase
VLAARGAAVVYALRLAVEADVPELEALMHRSVRALQIEYAEAQRESALRHVYAIDRVLIADGTYFVVTDGARIAACGGWSMHETLCAGEMHRNDALADPASEPAKIRAFFVDPRDARRGLGSMLLAASEDAAWAAGYRRCELGATLTGVPLYERSGYVATGRADIALPGGLTLEVVVMTKAAPTEGEPTKGGDAESGNLPRRST